MLKLRDLDRLADEVAPPPRHQPRPAADQAGERLARGRDTNRRRFAEQLQNERHFGIVVGADGEFRLDEVRQKEAGGKGARDALVIGGRASCDVGSSCADAHVLWAVPVPRDSSCRVVY